MIRAIGPRAVIKPIEVAQPSDVVQLTDYEPPSVGKVVSVGKHRCDECGCTQAQEFKEGDIVLIPHYGGQEVTIEGETYWFVRLEHIIGHWQADERVSA
jgi:co-chaperonin GroES (HSP10)